MIGISGSLIWSKTLMELIFNPCGEFRLSLEGPVRQIHSHHLLVGALRPSQVFLRSVQMLKREWGAEKNGKLPHVFSLQPWFLSLRWKIWLRQNCSLGFCACSEGPAIGQNILMMMMMMNMEITKFNKTQFKYTLNVRNCFTK